MVCKRHTKVFLIEKSCEKNSFVRNRKTKSNVTNFKMSSRRRKKKWTQSGKDMNFRRPFFYRPNFLTKVSHPSRSLRSSESDITSKIISKIIWCKKNAISLYLKHTEKKTHTQKSGKSMFDASKKKSVTYQIQLQWCRLTLHFIKKLSLNYLKLTIAMNLNFIYAQNLENCYFQLNSHKEADINQTLLWTPYF